MTPAVLYLRMSSDKQEASIPDQRAALKKYAKANGFRIVGEYSDEAISGDDTLRRVSFRQMIEDASSRKFEAILAWDQDRFGRFDLIEAGRWVQPLREAGVFLETIGQGRVDWTDFAGRLVYSVAQEGKHSFLRDLSRNAMRGLRSAAESGKVITSRPPLGYKIIDGKYVVDHPSAKIVRRLFQSYLDGLSSQRLARDLNAEGVPTCTGALWSGSTVIHILKNSAYIGTYRWGGTTRSKYNAMRGGQIVPVKRQATQRQKQDAVEFQNHHPAIIDRSMFDRVQKEIPLRRSKTSPHNIKTPFALTGLLICGECGQPMYGRRRRSGRAFYACSATLNSGGCSYNPVDQSILLAEIVRMVTERFTTPDFMDDVEAEIRQQFSSAAAKPNAAADLKKQLAIVDSKIRKGESRLLDCEDDFWPILKRQLRDLRTQKAEIEEQLRLCGKTVKGVMAEARERIQSSIAALHRLEKRISMIQPEDAGRELRKLLQSVKVHVSKEWQECGRYAYRLESVEIAMHSW